MEAFKPPLELDMRNGLLFLLHLSVTHTSVLLLSYSRNIPQTLFLFVIPDRLSLLLYICSLYCPVYTYPI